MCSSTIFIVFFLIQFTFSAQLFAGDSCIIRNSNGPRQSGKCIAAEKCPWAIKQIKLRQHPQICEFKGNAPIVCCLTSNNNGKNGNNGSVSEKIQRKSPQDIAKEACQESLIRPNNTAFVNTLKLFVVGGVHALAREYKHMAILGFGESNDIQWLCGGSLISKTFVLTAAHCLFSREFGDVKYVRVGDLDIKNENDNADPQDFLVKRSIRHPQYAPPSQYNDIALIELNKEVRISLYVNPACLWTEQNLDFSKFFPGEIVATGWGKTEFQGDPSSHLLEVKLALVSNEVCKGQFRSTQGSKLSNGIDDKSQICAESAQSDKVGDTCEGDSGGPLQTKDDNKFFVFGVTSFGKPCGVSKTAGVYTRVSNFIPWIAKIVWPQ